jgi:hypothetical protein
MECEKCKYHSNSLLRNCLMGCSKCKYADHTLEEEPCINCCEDDCKFEPK